MCAPLFVALFPWIHSSNYIGGLCPMRPYEERCRILPSKKINNLAKFQGAVLAIATFLRSCFVQRIFRFEHSNLFRFVRLNLQILRLKLTGYLVLRFLESDILS